MFAGRMTFHRLTKYAAAASMAAVVALLLAAAPASAQAADSMYVAPASGSFGTGSSFSIDIRVNTSGVVNAVQADMTYSSNLQFVAIDASGSPFAIDASSTGSNGLVSIARATTVPVKGDQLLAKVTFRVLSAGTGGLQFNNSSVALSSTTNTNVLTSRTGASYGLAGAAVPPTPTPTPVTPTPSNNSGSQSGSLPKITIATQGTDSPTALPGDSYVELTAPAVIETTPDASREVEKVEYLINGKLAATDTDAPYNFTLDTSKYRNGTYSLTTKTYYKDGAVDTSTASIAVKNAFSLMQFWLQLRHYAWLVVIVLVVIAELVYLKFFRHRGGPRAPGGFGRRGGTGRDPFAPVGRPSVPRTGMVIRPPGTAGPQPAAGSSDSNGLPQAPFQPGSGPRG